MNSKNVCVIADSLFFRQKRIILLKNKFISKIKSTDEILFLNYNIIDYKISANNTNKLNDIIKKIKKYKIEIILINLGIVDCYPRYKNKNDDNLENYYQFVPIKKYESNINNLINNFPNTKIYYLSIMYPNKNLTIMRGKNYYEYVKKEIDIYNNLLKKIDEKNKNFFFINLYNNLQKIYDKYEIEYTDIFFDNSGHLHEYKDICNKQKVINIYTELCELTINERLQNNIPS
jgi:hypothetical protein